MTVKDRPSPGLMARLPASVEYRKGGFGACLIVLPVLMAAGLCCAGGRVKGARSARGAAPEARLTRLSGKRIMPAAGQGACWCWCGMRLWRIRVAASRGAG